MIRDVTSSTARAIATGLTLASIAFLVPLAFGLVHETVDTEGDVGQFGSLALDPLGRPCIAYYDVTRADLRFACRTEAGWVVETVDADGDVGRYASLAMDASGDAFVAYSDATNQALKLAARRAGVWTVETVTFGWCANRSPSLALGADGNPWIGYKSGGAACFARWNGTTWQHQCPGEWAWGCYGTALALASEHHPRIAYYTDLWYVILEEDGGTWREEIACVAPVSRPEDDAPIRLVIDADGDPHLVVAPWVWPVFYTSRRDGLWGSSVFTASGDFPSLAIDPSGNPCIVYYDGWIRGGGAGDLEMAVRRGAECAT